MPRQASLPFLYRKQTHEDVAAIAHLNPLVIYAGAGATIDKSGINWETFVEGLLEPNIPDANRRKQIVKSQGIQQAASIACQIFKDIHCASDPEESFDDLAGASECQLGTNSFWHERLCDQVRTLLYGNARTWGEGRLAENITTYLLLRQQHRYRSALATVNYDDYLIRELGETIDAAKKERIPTPDIDLRYPEWLVDKNGHPAPDSATDSAKGGSSLPCYLLHGYVPRNTRDHPACHPIISERDYHDSAPHTEGTLTTLLSSSNMLIIGASLADPPLNRALLRTKNSKYSRYALLPLQGSEWESFRAGSPALGLHDIRARFVHLGVKPIYPDFFIEAGQFVDELVACFQAGLKSPSKIPYPYHHSPSRYDARLAAWWKKWTTNDTDPEKQSEKQDSHHEVLFRVMHSVRTLLETPADEQLKVELWILWNPEHQQTLRLWASSVGPRKAVDTMHSESIPSDDTSIAVAAFRKGSTHFSATETGMWPTCLASPLWLTTSECRPVPVGVVTLASTKGSTSGSISQYNRASVIRALRIIRANAARMLYE